MSAMPPAAPESPPAPQPVQQPAPLHLVFGASGYIGSHLVPRLQRDGLRVRACARDLAVLQARAWSGVEGVEADALRPETLGAALQGVDTAYYLVHSMAAGADFARLDRTAAVNFAAAAAQAGVRRIVYLGGLMPAQPTSAHLVSRRETGECLRAGPVPVTELRAGIIVGPGSAAYEVIRDLVNHLPLMLTPRWVRSRAAPIALDNLLDDLVGVAALEEAAGQIYDTAGPEMLSYEAMMRQYGEVVGRRPRIIPVPVLTPTLSAYWLGLVTAVPANIARALIGGLKHDLPADDAPLRRLLPRRLMGFREAVRAALQAEQQHTVAARWSEGQLMFRGFRLDNAFYAKRAGGEAQAAVPEAAVWHTVATIGGDQGYHSLPWLWRLRALVDWLAGGPGMTRGRRHPTELRIGDRIDYWTVLALEPGRRLTLHFGMRAPGSGVLEFEVQPVAPPPSAPQTQAPQAQAPQALTPHALVPEAAPAAAAPWTRLRITAYWHPRGLWGLLYWYALVPAHLVIFDRMAHAMLQKAGASAASRGGGGGPLSAAR